MVKEIYASFTLMASACMNKQDKTAKKNLSEVKTKPQKSLLEILRIQSFIIFKTVLRKCVEYSVVS